MPPKIISGWKSVLVVVLLLLFLHATLVAVNCKISLGKTSVWRSMMPAGWNPLHLHVQLDIRWGQSFQRSISRLRPSPPRWWWSGRGQTARRCCCIHHATGKSDFSNIWKVMFLFNVLLHNCAVQKRESKLTIIELDMTRPVCCCQRRCRRWVALDHASAQKIYHEISDVNDHLYSKWRSWWWRTLEMEERSV